jgi:hypothetical protein
MRSPGIDIERAAHGRPGDYIDDAAHRRVAPERGAAAAHDLDTIDIVERNAVPLDIAEERVVDRHAVEQHQHAGLGRRQAAHAFVIGGRMADIRADLVERHARQQLQDVVQALGRRVLDLIGGNDTDAGRHIPQRLGGSGGRDHNGFGRGRLAEGRHGREHECSCLAATAVESGGHGCSMRRRTRLWRRGRRSMRGKGRT